MLCAIFRVLRRYFCSSLWKWSFFIFLSFRFVLVWCVYTQFTSFAMHAIARWQHVCISSCAFYIYNNIPMLCARERRVRDMAGGRYILNGDFWILNSTNAQYIVRKERKTNKKLKKLKSTTTRWARITFSCYMVVMYVHRQFALTCNVNDTRTGRPNLTLKFTPWLARARANQQHNYRAQNAFIQSVLCSVICLYSRTF